MSEVLNPFEIAQKQIKTACDILGYDDNIYEVLKNPEQVVTVSIPVRMDDGSIKSFKVTDLCTIQQLARQKAAFVFILA